MNNPIKPFLLFLSLYVSLHPLSAHNMPDWVDVPQLSCAEIFPGLPNTRLDKLLTEYNSISNIKLETLDIRIKLLKKIAHECDFVVKKYCHSDLKYLKNRVESLGNIAHSKMLYLEKLKELPSVSIDHLLGEKKTSCLSLHHKLEFDPVIAQYWGLYELEKIDPCHRALEPYFIKWSSQNKKETNIIHFFLWLEDQIVPKKMRYYHYLKEKAYDLQVHVVKSLLYTKSKKSALKPLHTRGEDWLFIINNDNQLIVSPESEFIRHSSLSSGSDVLGIGLLNVKHGNIEKISLESGHYIPTINDHYNTLLRLCELVGHIKDTTPVNYYYNFTKHKTSVKAFLSFCKGLSVNARNRYKD